MYKRQNSCEESRKILHYLFSWTTIIIGDDMECPVCKQRMKMEKIESAWVDICAEHGVWLDKGEIEHVIESAREIGKSEGFVTRLWSATHY